VTSSPSLTARVAEYGNERSHCWRGKKRPATIISYLSHSGEIFEVCRGRPARKESNTLSGQTWYSLWRSSTPTWPLVVRKQYKTDEWRRQLREMKDSLRPDNEVDIDDTEPAKKAKDLEKSPYMELTPAWYCVVRDYLLCLWRCRMNSVQGYLKRL